MKRRRQIRTVLAYLLLAGGAFFLYRGIHEYLGSRLGQTTAEQEFENPVPVPPPEAVAPNQHIHIPRGTTVAKLILPRQGKQLYVVEGVDHADLRLGPGHMPGSALPGADGNCIIAGHRDTHFRVLKDIRQGDDIVLETRTGEFLYRVKTMHIVSPTDTASLQPSNGPVLHLITCYPFYYLGSAPKRFVVDAELAGALDASLPLKPHS